MRNQIGALVSIRELFYLSTLALLGAFWPQRASAQESPTPPTQNVEPEGVESKPTAPHAAPKPAEQPGAGAVTPTPAGPKPVSTLPPSPQPSAPARVGSRRRVGPCAPCGRASRRWQPDTWFGSGKVEIGGYGGPMVRASELAGDGALLVGGRGGFLFDHRVIVGIGGFGQAINFDAPSEARVDNEAAENLEFGYGGALIGYHLAPDRIVHGLFSLLIGGGALALSNRGDGDLNRDIDQKGDAIFALEPEVGIETNIANFFRAQLTVSYRRVWGVDMPGLDNEDVSGISGGIGLAFGRF